MAHKDVEAKIVVLGASGVGKTALLNRYMNNTFDADSRPTVGANFLTKRFLSPDTHPPTSVRLQIWDTAGQERFRSISKLYYRGADAAILCYDITDERSFVEMGTWLDELRKNLGQNCIIHVVGTKVDAVADDPLRRQVTFERCIQYVSEHLHGKPAQSGALSWSTPQTPGADQRNSGFWGSDVGWDCCHEISSKDGDGVDEVFRVLTRKLVEQRSGNDKTMQEPVKPAGSSDGDYFGQSHTKGSFRLGIGNKRRSWLPFPSASVPQTPWTTTGSDQGQTEEGSRGKCC